MFKRFFDWITIKERLHKNEFKPPYVKERDIWWASIGENIGSEINGKSSIFSRPAIILKKLSRSFFRIAPTTSKEHTGSWYVQITHNTKNMFVCLHQIRTIDYRRLSSKLGQLNKEEFKTIKDNFLELYK